MNVQAVNKFLLIKPMEDETKKSSIIITKIETDNLIGEVVSSFDEDKFKLGSKICYNNGYTLYKDKESGQDYHIIDEEAVYFVFK